MKRRDFLGALGSGLATALVPTVRRPGRPPLRLIERWSWAMGQPVHLHLFASSADYGYAAAEEALAELRLVEQHLSRFIDSSDLNELNRCAGRDGIRVSPVLQRVLRASLGFERLTGGAFNPAVEPLMRVWGFHAHRTSEPTASELGEARKAVLAARIVQEGPRVRLPSAHTSLDLGGIGVGYGLDRAILRLRALDVRSAFLNVSGDCYALGAPPGEDGWLVDIASPHPGQPPVASTRLRDAALATSSNAVSVVRYGRAVRGHVMDPQTGWPAAALAQVSVVASTGIEADALSTAMLVSGKPGKGVLRYYRV
jgi:FAD:protein FMN transferase